MTSVGLVLAALLPTVGVAVLFAIAIRAIIRADASERAAERQFGASQAKPRPDNRDVTTREAD